MMTVKGHPGIRKKPNGKYIACKSIKGTRFNREFDTLREATHWKNTFVPLGPMVNGKVARTAPGKSGGSDVIYFGDVVEQYKKQGMLELTEYTRYKKTLRMNRFLEKLSAVPMQELGPGTVTQHLEYLKAINNDASRRCNFDKELKDLASIFSWYAEDISPVENPVRQKHFKIGKIKDIEKKRKHLTLDELNRFMKHLDEPFLSIATLQFLLGARIGEVVALSTDTVDFVRRTITISDNLVWIKGSPTLARTTKTGAVSVREMTDVMLETLVPLNEKRPKGCKFFFHRKGKPLRYALILAGFNEALDKAGLSAFSGTHVIRHTMATFSRQEGGLDVAQAMLSHSTSRQTEGYAQLDKRNEMRVVVNLAEEAIRPGRKVRATKCDQGDFKTM